MSRLGWMCFVVADVGCGRRDFNEGVVDAPIPIDSVPCTEPPVGCMNPTVYVCGGTCFAACKQVVSRPAAAAACADWGGCLAVAKTQNANDCAASQLMGLVGWIGLLQPTSATAPSAGWEWCDGAPFTFKAWRFGSPDDGDTSENGIENCAIILPDGTWSDETCALTGPFVCSRSL